MPASKYAPTVSTGPDHDCHPGTAARSTRSGNVLTLTALFLGLLAALPGQATYAAPGHALDAAKARVIEHWTPQRRAEAIPRDLVIDPRGLGYMKKPDGSLEPYGHQIAAEASPRKGPPSGGDTQGPIIMDLDPAMGTTIGTSKTFSAIVTDAESSIKSVTFVIQYPDSGPTQSFNASRESNGSDRWTVPLNGFSDGNWSWWVEARDGASKGGNSSVSDTVNFSVDTAGGGDGGGDTGGETGSDTVVNAHWSDGGAVQTAAGRIYFEMPGNAKRKGPWSGYVCSGTVVTDSATDRSIILTAAHCVYDDANKAFARNMLFIPNQDGTDDGARTDLDCSNDPLGCWVPSFGVVDENWTLATFPDNIPWDYAYYVVDDSGAHQGTDSYSPYSGILDSDAGSLPISFNAPNVDDGSAGAETPDFTHALGYSYSDDPNFMYCAEDMTIEDAFNWWLPSCGLSGGASGGPWVQPMGSDGSGPVISVNSWGYTNQPGMAGPKLSGTSAECAFTEAQSWADVTLAFWLDMPQGDAGITVTPDDCSSN